MCDYHTVINKETPIEVPFGDMFTILFMPMPKLVVAQHIQATSWQTGFFFELAMSD